MNISDFAMIPTGLDYTCPPNQIVTDMISPQWRIIIAFCFVSVVLLARDMSYYERELVRLGGKPSVGIIVGLARKVLAGFQETKKNDESKEKDSSGN